MLKGLSFRIEDNILIRTLTNKEISPERKAFLEKLSQRVRLVRAVHHISIYDAEELSYSQEKIISRSTISKWENKKAVPDIETLQTFADCFGINVEWLKGNTNAPYDEDNILKLERAMFCENVSTKRLISIYIDGQEIVIFPTLCHEIPDYYLDEEKRKNTYSLVQRANIIFLLNTFAGMVIKRRGSFSRNLDGTIEFNHSRFNGKHPVFTLYYYCIGSFPGYLNFVGVRNNPSNLPEIQELLEKQYQSVQAEQLKKEPLYDLEHL